MTSNRNRTAVLALGGNAISPKGEVDTIANQFSHTRESLSAIRELVGAEKIVIAAGGGGIPVYTMESGDLEGFDAVVDKDLASAIVAHEIGACDFFILTDVRTVFLNFGQKNETPIHRMTVTEAQTYLKEGQFTPGTMEPKISAAMDFINRGGERVFISAIDSLAEALLGETGTVITNHS